MISSVRVRVRIHVRARTSIRFGIRSDNVSRVNRIAISVSTIQHEMTMSMRMRNSMTSGASLMLSISGFTAPTCISLPHDRLP